MNSIILVIGLFISSAFGAGIELTKNKDYGAALAQFSICSPTREQRCSFFFYRAVCYHQLMMKKEALSDINNLLDGFDPIPSRYEQTAWAMKIDLDKWKEGTTLEGIGRKMNGVGARLEVARAGDETQRQQKSIIEDLNKLIKEQEDAKLAKSDNPPEFERTSKNPIPTTPEEVSKIVDSLGKGNVDDKKLKKLADVWGTLPPSQREKVMQEVTRNLPNKHRFMIEQYFRELNRLK